MEATRNVFQSVGQKTKAKRLLGSHVPGWAYNTKMSLKCRMDENKCQNLKRELFIQCFRCSSETNYIVIPTSQSFVPPH
jgi:hypothetical protein